MALLIHSGATIDVTDNVSLFVLINYESLLLFCMSTGIQEEFCIIILVYFKPFVSIVNFSFDTWPLQTWHETNIYNNTLVFILLHFWYNIEYVD